ncbi:MAG: multicopper oxidase family protein [Rhizobiaceae bacterium]
MKIPFHPNRRQLLSATGATIASASLPRLSLAKTDDGFFQLAAGKTSQRLAGDKYGPSDLFLYNGKTPGPQIRVKRGDTVRVRFTNELDQPTSVHWHGIRIDNAMDGVPGLTQEPVMPGGSFDYVFAVPDAGTFWYHAHTKSWEQVARGLYGPLIVDETRPSFPLDNDITLVIDDWRLNENGVLDMTSLGSLRDWSHAGRLGNWLTVNGVSQPHFKVKAGENYRLRLINACNARAVSFNPASIGAQILGYDGFVFDSPREFTANQLALTPAQRVDLLLQPRGGDTVKLDETGGFALEEISGREPVRFAIFDTDGTSDRPGNTPVTLSPNTISAPDLTTAKTVELVMTGGAMGHMGDMTHKGEPLTRGRMMETKQVWAFNGVANMSSEPLFRIQRGHTVIIKTVNQTGWLHAMHSHGHHFQIIRRNGYKPDDLIWRDTFSIDHDETVDIAFVADNPGKWLLHCHMLEHAAAGMRTWFEVT